MLVIHGADEQDRFIISTLVGKEVCWSGDILMNFTTPEKRECVMLLLDMLNYQFAAPGGMGGQITAVAPLGNGQDEG